MASENTNTLATKYRPRVFSDIVEQNIVTEMLEKICSAEELSCRNFLLTGPAGCGKTTSARAMAALLNKGQGEPIELDAASHSGVEAISSRV